MTKVLLKTDLLRKGKIGDIIEVAKGFARNYLIPNDLAIAIRNTKESQQEIKEFLDNINAFKEKIKVQENTLLTLIDTLTSITIKAKCSTSGSLFRSINNKIVAQNINEQLNIKIDHKFIMLSPIKTIGEHEGIINFQNNKHTFKIQVISI